MQQQQQQNGMAIGFPNGVNPQQMAITTNNQGQFPILPPHIQQQLAAQRQQMQQQQFRAGQIPILPPSIRQQLAAKRELQQLQQIQQIQALPARTREIYTKRKGKVVDVE